MIDRYNTRRFLSFQEGIPILGESSDVNVVWDSEDDSPDAEGLEELPERMRLPVLPLRGTVVFPSVAAPIAAGRDKTVKAIERALKGD